MKLNKYYFQLEVFNERSLFLCFPTTEKPINRTTGSSANRRREGKILIFSDKKTRVFNLLKTLIEWRRARDSNPRSRFSDLHDFQSCSFDQLGQLSIKLFCFLRDLLYNRAGEKSIAFSHFFL